MSVQTIGAAIEAVQLTVPAITHVYDYEGGELEGYPAATLEFAGHSGAFSDLSANRREYTFTVRVYFPLTANRSQSSESDIRALLDDLIAAVEANPTLSGTCEFATPTSSRVTYAEREMPTRVAELTIAARQRIIRGTG